MHLKKSIFRDWTSNEECSNTCVVLIYRVQDKCRHNCILLFQFLERLIVNDEPTHTITIRHRLIFDFLTFNYLYFITFLHAFFQLYILLLFIFFHKPLVSRFEYESPLSGVENKFLKQFQIKNYRGLIIILSILALLIYISG